MTESQAQQADIEFDNWKDRFADDRIGLYDSDLDRAEALCPADLIEEDLRNERN